MSPLSWLSAMPTVCASGDASSPGLGRCESNGVVVLAGTTGLLYRAGLWRAGACWEPNSRTLLGMEEEEEEEDGVREMVGRRRLGLDCILCSDP